MLRAGNIAKMLNQFSARVWLSVIAACFILVNASGSAYASAMKEVTPLPTVEFSIMKELHAETDPHWEDARKIVARSVMDLYTQHGPELGKSATVHTLIRGDISKKEIALTFDDGPHPTYTPKLLAILKQFNAKATFFVVGEMAEKYPNLIRDEIAAGHSVGNHTYHHVNLTKISPEYVATEIKACGEVIRDITGKPPHLFRPPGGDFNRQVSMVSTALDYTTVLWTDDPGDYASPGEAVINSRLMSSVNNGGIILIHDGIQQTIDVLPKILKVLQERGYKFVTIDEMLAHKAGNTVARAEIRKLETR
jgi:peptidoglycan-N-acetylglucosamine deacetylase